MTQYILRRLLTLIPILLIVSIVTFSLMSIVLGDPVILMLGRDVDPETVAHLREELGFNRPVYVQYWDWFSRLVSGDFGRSFRTPLSVSEALAHHIPVTLELTFISLSLAILIAIPAGTLAAVQRGSLLDTLVSGSAALVLAMPNFWLGILLIFFVALKLGWLPSAGYVKLGEDPVAHLRSMVLPSLTLSAAYTGALIRYVRALVLDAMSENYVVVARAKGLTSSIILRRHILRNTLIPVVTVVGLNVAGLFGGAVVTETVFALPGVGTLLVDSILGRDAPIVQGVVLFITVAVLLTNLLVDVTYGYLDPRIGYE